MAGSQEVIVLHAFEKDGSLGTTISERIRTTKTGKQNRRISIEIQAEPLVHVFDDKALGQEPAEAYVEMIRRQMRGQPMASAATRRRRTQMADQWRSGRISPDLKRRFSGGQTGDTPPKTGEEAPRLWSHSSRLFNGLVARWVPSVSAYIINKPANRLEQGGELARQFVEAIPALRNPAEFFRSSEFRAAADKSMRFLVQKAKDVNDAKRIALRKQQLRAFVGALRVARAIGGA